MKKKLFRIVGIVFISILTLIVLLSLVGTVAEATGLVDDTVESGNLYSKYSLNNYQLDFFVDSSWDWLPWNWGDGLGKSVMYGLYAITNFIWTVSLYLSNATGYVVQEAYKLDFISDTAESIGKNIQTLADITENGLQTSGFYFGFLLLMILALGVYVAYTGLLKRETTKAVRAVINFVMIFYYRVRSLLMRLPISQKSMTLAQMLVKRPLPLEPRSLYPIQKAKEKIVWI